MAIDPEMKLNKYNKGKYLLRHAFEGDYLPHDILYREKAAFSDAVGHSMVDYLKEYANNYTFKAPKDFCFKAIGLNCGSYNIRISGKKSLTGMLMADYLPEQGSKKELELLCCTDHVTEYFPPVFVIFCFEEKPVKPGHQVQPDQQVEIARQ